MIVTKDTNGYLRVFVGRSHALSDAEALAKTARVLLGIPEPWGVAE